MASPTQLRPSGLRPTTSARDSPPTADREVPQNAPRSTSESTIHSETSNTFVPKHATRRDPFPSHGDVYDLSVTAQSTDVDKRVKRRVDWGLNSRLAVTGVCDCRLAFWSAGIGDCEVGASGGELFAEEAQAGGPPAGIFGDHVLPRELRQVFSQEFQHALDHAAARVPGDSRSSRNV